MIVTLDVTKSFLRSRLFARHRERTSLKSQLLRNGCARCGWSRGNRPELPSTQKKLNPLTTPLPGPAQTTLDAVGPSMFMRLIELGCDDREAVEFFRAGARTWFADGDRPLHRCLGLQADRAAVRRALRNDILRAAAEHIGTWNAAGDLAAAVVHFADYRWPRWRALVKPPLHATTRERRLFHAFRIAGGEVPRSVRALYRILGACRT